MGPLRIRKDLPPPHGPGCTCHRACTRVCICLGGRFNIRRYFEAVIMHPSGGDLLPTLVALETLFAEPASQFAQEETVVADLQLEFKKRGGPAGPV